MVTKVGMRGNEADDATENETGLVWVGATTNYASRLCSLAKPCEIYIDETTFTNIQDVDGWIKESVAKGTKIFSCYLSCEYYLEVPEDACKPIKSMQQTSANETEVCYALVSLYQSLGLYDKAYEALCIQAETFSWILATT